MCRRRGVTTRSGGQVTQDTRRWVCETTVPPSLSQRAKSFAGDSLWHYRAADHFTGKGMAALATDLFTAAPSALGYLYQCRLALCLLLERIHNQPDAQIAIERFDDISFEQYGTPEELIQVKHHLGSSPNFGDTSDDIWKTLRAWSTAVSNGVVTVPGTIFTIVTTTECSANTAAIFLRDGDGRDVEEAHKKLVAAASRMKGKNLKPARDAFAALGSPTQRSLLEAVHVIDKFPTITDVVGRIRKAVGFPVPVARIPVFIRRLEGWWFHQVIERLAGKNDSPISGVSLGLEMDDLRSSFSEHSLPLQFKAAKPPSSPDWNVRVFVKQLRLIGLDGSNLNWARTDFFRAFAERSQWLTDDLLNITQLGDYDTVLTEEWERRRDWIEREAKADDCEADLVSRGLSLYQHLQENCRPIRQNCVEQYVGRGSYQMLADRKLVGWHKQFLDRLSETVEDDGDMRGERDAVE